MAYPPQYIKLLVMKYSYNIPVQLEGCLHGNSHVHLHNFECSSLYGMYMDEYPLGQSCILHRIKTEHTYIQLPYTNNTYKSDKNYKRYEK
jgi:hypothetical protein